jgi:hypothetical protein
MSHISKIDTTIKDLRILKKALKNINMECIEAKNNQLITVLGYGKNELIENCIMEIKTGCKYSIGVRKVDQNYELVADWWAIETFTGLKQEDILNKITRQYAYENVLEKVKDMGYNVVDEKQDLQQNVKLTLRRWK